MKCARRRDARAHRHLWTTRGTLANARAATLLNSVLTLVTLSDTISTFSPAKSPPESFIQTAAVPQTVQLLRQRTKFTAATSFHHFAEYLPRSACGACPLGNPCLFCKPRLAQLANKSVPGKNAGWFSFNPVPEKTEIPIRPEKIPLPRPIS